MQVRLREKIERKEGNEITDSTEIQEEEYWMMVTCVNGRVKNESEWDLLCLINKKESGCYNEVLWNMILSIIFTTKYQTISKNVCNNDH